MTEHPITPSQTVGPFFAFALTPDDPALPALAKNDLVTEDAVGQVIGILGRVFDGAGEPVPDAMVEIWQADGAGRFARRSGALPNTQFQGFGRCGTAADGQFSFKTVKPGALPMPDGGWQAPHIAVNLFARGLLRQLVTRIYFADESGNGADPVLALVPEELRKTLIAERIDDRPTYRFDIHLQGEAETVFFAA